MKKRITAFAMAATLLALPTASQAHRYDSDDSDHPLRYIAYAVHPVGIAVEHLVLRPIHCLISGNKTVAYIFGHEPKGNDSCDYNYQAAVVKTTTQDVSEIEKVVASAPSVTAQPAAGDDRAIIAGLEPAKDMFVVYFDYNRSNLRGDQVDRIEQNLKYLKDHPELNIVIEGHCDERGTNEYNLALGERRARQVRDYFVKNGIDAKRIVTMSKGEEEPADSGHDETAWAKNRRAEFEKQIK